MRDPETMSAEEVKAEMAILERIVQYPAQRSKVRDLADRRWLLLSDNLEKRERAKGQENDNT